MEKMAAEEINGQMDENAEENENAAGQAEGEEERGGELTILDLSERGKEGEEGDVEGVREKEEGSVARSLGDVLDTPALPLLLDVPMEVAVEVDRVQLSLAEVVGLQPGAVIQLTRVPGEPLDLLVNGRLVARGEIVVVNDVFAFRITEIVDVGLSAKAA